METNSIKLLRKELYDLVWSNSMVTLSKRFAISDNGLRKICERMNIPLPGNGHWMKLQFNKKVKVIPLPEDADVDQTVEIKLRQEGTDDDSMDPVKKLAKEINVVVAERLHSPDELVVAAKQVLTAKDKHIHNGTLRTYRDALDINVSPSGIPRALLLFDILIKALRGRGHGIFFKNGETFAKVKGQDLQIKLREQTKRVKGENSWAEYEATGIFYFKIDRYPDKEFKDGTRKLEEKIADIIAWMEIQSDNDNARDEQWRIEEEAERLEEKRVQAIAAERQGEMQRYRELIGAANRWKKAELIREYVASVLAAGGSDPAWVEWARKKADWLDPAVQAEDGLLGRYWEDGK
jgi:hypothetical protein